MVSRLGLASVALVSGPNDIRQATISVVNALSCDHHSGFARAIGFDGILLLLFLVAIPIAVAALGVIYVRAMSWLFDVIVGPFLLR